MGCFLGFWINQLKANVQTALSTQMQRRKDDNKKLNQNIFNVTYTSVFIVETGQLNFKNYQSISK